MNDFPAGLHAALLDAHAVDDLERLARLYALAADASERAGDENAAGFFLTQAWVFSLQAGLPDAALLRDRLARLDRV